MAVEAIFKNGSTHAFTRTLHQYDKGQVLMILGIELPSEYYVHFSNDKYFGVAYSVRGSYEGVKIPDAYLMTGDYIYAWVSTEDTTRYSIVIPVARKPVSVVDPTKKTKWGYVYDEETHSIEYKEVPIDGPEAHGGYVYDEETHSIEWRD